MRKVGIINLRFGNRKLSVMVSRIFNHDESQLKVRNTSGIIHKDDNRLLQNNLRLLHMAYSRGCFSSSSSISLAVDTLHCTSKTARKGWYFCKSHISARHLNPSLWKTSVSNPSRRKPQAIPDHGQYARSIGLTRVRAGARGAAAAWPRLPTAQPAARLGNARDDSWFPWR